MTLTELTEHVRLAVKRQVAALSDELIYDYINWAIEDLALARDWNEMMEEHSGTLVASTSRHSFPTRLKNIYDLRLNSSSGTKLRMIDPRTFDSEYPKPSQLGTSSDPWAYADFGSWFEIIPQLGSNTTAYMKCSILPETLDSGSETPSLVHKDRVIILQAQVHAFIELQEFELAGTLQDLSTKAYLLAVEGDKKPKDWSPYARPYSMSTRASGESWKNPFVRG